MTRRSSSIQSGSVGYGTTSNCDSDSIENSEKGNIGVDENDFIEDDTTDNDDSHEMTVMAVYDYDGACGESSIPITSGEYLVLVEDDIEGWTKVRRKFNKILEYSNVIEYSKASCSSDQSSNPQTP